MALSSDQPGMYNPGLKIVYAEHIRLRKRQLKRNPSGCRSKGLLGNLGHATLAYKSFAWVALRTLFQDILTLGAGLGRREEQMPPSGRDEKYDVFLKARLTFKQHCRDCVKPLSVLAVNVLRKNGHGLQFAVFSCFGVKHQTIDY